MTLSEIEPVTFRLAAQCLNLLLYRRKYGHEIYDLASSQDVKFDVSWNLKEKSS
jgi:hypothetical protein